MRLFVMLLTVSEITTTSGKQSQANEYAFRRHHLLQHGEL